jgi:dihydroorotate dehydrogenase
LFIEVHNPVVVAQGIQTDLSQVQTWADKQLASFSLAKTMDMAISLKTNKPDHLTFKYATMLYQESLFIST